MEETKEQHNKEAFDKIIDFDKCTITKQDDNKTKHSWGVNYKNDLEEFRKIGKDVIDFIVDTQLKLHEKPVTPVVEPGFMKELINYNYPNHPTNFSTVLGEAYEKVINNTTHWNHPGFLTWYPSMTQFPAILGNLISDCFNNPNVCWKSNPAGFELEKVIMDWLKDALGLPENFTSKSSGACVHFAAGESNVIASLSSRQKKRELYPGQESKFTYYASEQAHYSVFKGINITGSKVFKIPVVWSKDKENYIMDIEFLKNLVEEHEKQGLIPTYICATIGTTGTSAIDDIENIGIFCKDKKIWFHIDAAYIGNTFICPEFRKKYSNGIHLAQSMAINGNKFMPVSENSGFFFVEEATHVFKALNNDYVFYLQHQDHQTEMINYEVGTARASKSLRLYMTFKTLGFDKIREIIRRLINHAKRIDQALEESGRFKIFVPTNFALVCFQLKDRPKSDLEQYLNFVLNEGKVIIGPFMLNDQYFLRISLNNQYLDEITIESTIQYLIKAYDRLFSKNIDDSNLIET